MTGQKKTSFPRKISLLKNALASDEVGFSETIKAVIFDVIASLKSCIDLENISMAQKNLDAMKLSVTSLIKTSSVRDCERFKEFGGNMIFQLLEEVEDKINLALSDTLKYSKMDEVTPKDPETEVKNILKQKKTSKEKLQQTTSDNNSDKSSDKEKKYIKRKEDRKAENFKNITTLLEINEYSPIIIQEFSQQPLPDLLPIDLFDPSIESYDDADSKDSLLKDIILYLSGCESDEIKKLQDQLARILKSYAETDTSLEKIFFAKVKALLSLIVNTDNPIKQANQAKELLYKESSYAQKIKFCKVQKTNLEQILYRKYPNMKNQILSYIETYKKYSPEKRIDNKIILELYSSISVALQDFFTLVTHSEIELLDNITVVKLQGDIVPITKLLDKEQSKSEAGPMGFALSLMKPDSSFMKTIDIILQSIKTKLDNKHEEIEIFILRNRNYKVSSAS